MPGTGLAMWYEEYISLEKVSMGSLETEAISVVTGLGSSFTGHIVEGLGVATGVLELGGINPVSWAWLFFKWRVRWSLRPKRWAQRGHRKSRRPVCTTA